ncbi:MAG: TraI domain-containing protein [Xanthomonadaceae bacterium]|nr:TraI domain-containing protein [Xanthomonadaceae bacterium]
MADGDKYCSGARVSADAASDDVQRRNGISPAFTYPSVDPGFPTLGLDHILNAHAELLSRIKVCYGSDRETFEREVMALVRRYAAFVHLLPATPANYFSEPGGLLRLGLETAFYALQGTDAHIFSGRATIAARRHIEPRWRLATFIAGLCAEIHRTIGQVIVTDRAGTEWPPYLQGLQPWLIEHTVDRYYLKWLPNAPESRGLAVFALPLIVPATTLQHLALGNTVVVPHMMASLSGMPLPRAHNILAELVRRAAALVIDRFLEASADRSGKVLLGFHLERYLVDALRRLVATHAAWTPNAERSRIWYGADGLFMVWPNAAGDVRKLLEADQLPGMPKSAETMLEILVGAGILQLQDDGGPLWLIYPPHAKAAIEAVKLIDPAIVLAGLEPRPDASAAVLLRSSLGAINTPPPPLPGPAPADGDGVATGSPAAHALSQLGTAHAVDHALCTSIPKGHQLELQVSLTSSSHEGSHPPTTCDATAHKPPINPRAPLEVPKVTDHALRLDASMRLASRVREALADIVAALNMADRSLHACTTSDGLFIALAEFERRHIEPSQALRALSEAGMLAHGPQAKPSTSTCAIAGQQHLGLTVASAFLAGWQPLPASMDAAT